MKLNNYKELLESTGFTVHEYFDESDREYSGEWLARVTTPDGENGYIRGFFGSCSGCDELEAMRYDLIYGEEQLNRQKAEKLVESIMHECFFETKEELKANLKWHSDTSWLMGHINKLKDF